jgi:hypothetical protein
MAKVATHLKDMETVRTWLIRHDHAIDDNEENYVRYISPAEIESAIGKEVESVAASLRDLEEAGEVQRLDGRVVAILGSKRGQKK